MYKGTLLSGKRKWQTAEFLNTVSKSHIAFLHICHIISSERNWSEHSIVFGEIFILLSEKWHEISPCM
jgi:hypothetical protein